MTLKTLKITCPVCGAHIIRIRFRNPQACFDICPNAFAKSGKHAELPTQDKPFNNNPGA